MRSGVPGLDRLLGGGLKEGRIYAIVGPTGAGKTTLALQIMVYGASRGERGLILPLSEPFSELESNGRSVAIPTGALVKTSRLFVEDIMPEGGIVVMDTRKVRDLILNNVQGHIAESGVRRVMVDAAELAFEGTPTTEDVSFLRALKGGKESGPCVIVTLHSEEGELPPITRYLDGLITIHLHQHKDGIRRTIHVQKHRGQAHRSEVHELTFGPKGLEVGRAVGTR